MDQSDAVPEAVPDLLVECGASGGGGASSHGSGDQPDARSMNL